ncbi:hypothetical protein [Flavicella sediminum]|uniref:hypothetical protein n=1 Tax=Flavicella sediminum TaxID=2585141 RepID=UPI00111CFF52|nr:hypothetical protein [Flavicella sediminum]
MNTQNKRVAVLGNFKALILICLLAFVGCGESDAGNEMDVAPETTEKSYSITVGVFIQNGNTYTDQNKDLVFVTQDACQSWSRTASGDDHNASSHLHYNAAKNTSYNATTETITWKEYGPEISQELIDATCDNGSNGATKTADKTSYHADKNFFLKIKAVVEQ